MNYKSVISTLGKILFVTGALMLLPLVVTVIYRENTYAAFIIPSVILIVIGFLMTRLRDEHLKIYTLDGIVICGLSWILMSFFGALPFVIDGCIPNFLDAFFETVSGFTTTGSTILSDIESLPRSILFWRSFTHLIGGMGILTFVIAILPKSDTGNMNIMKAEVPGPKAGKIVAKLQNSIRILYIIYFSLTLIEIILLLCGGMNLFDSIVNSFATAGTGGFALLNNSIAGYNSPYFEWVFTVFMFLFGVNFNIYFFIIIGKVSSVFRDEEFRTYIIINVVSALLITVNIASLYPNISDAIRNAFFNVSTVMSTTGFCTADFELWPAFSKTLLVLLMFFGGCAGSTGGGMKISRLVLCAKQIRRGVKQAINPREVINIKVNGEIIEKDVLRGLHGYLTVYFVLLAVSTLVISLQGLDLVTNLTSTISCMNNIGPGLSLIGPVGNYSVFNPLSKIVLIIDMLAGRLEIFPILILFIPSTWRKR